RRYADAASPNNRTASGPSILLPWSFKPFAALFCVVAHLSKASFVTCCVQPYFRANSSMYSLSSIASDFCFSSFSIRAVVHNAFEPHGVMTTSRDCTSARRPHSPSSGWLIKQFFFSTTIVTFAPSRNFEDRTILNLPFASLCADSLSTRTVVFDTGSPVSVTSLPLSLICCAVARLLKTTTTSEVHSH